MSKRSRRAAPRPRGAPPHRTRWRGGGGGPPPLSGLDHTAQLRDLRQALDGTATVRVTNCLDACERANVIVVQPSAEGRKNGGRPVWLGLVNDPDAAAEITTWVREGGPGITDPPDILGLYAFQPSRRIRAELHDE
ncbi:(2Fe-2S) ferredoxin domain-containing protein [Streptomyces globisporus]|uniref:(2Fe-2S) ferredoxin domain-containing protein n=1 Tax=Streptomyces globisporus TaxID=1908 RepID=UPI0036B78CF4